MYPMLLHTMSPHGRSVWADGLGVVMEIPWTQGTVGPGRCLVYAGLMGVSVMVAPPGATDCDASQ